ncbi:MAG: thiol-disulfide oxidoreductase DCC family protein [Pseudomonadales bacterium]|nr:thiol-disulfide oxidoreductase DCC family protein [Pseudomonadales bacterium]
MSSFESHTTDNDLDEMLRGPVVVFDGVCNLCEDSVAFIIARDPQAKFKFVSAQSAIGKQLQERLGIDAIRDETVILIKEGEVFTHSDAGLEISKDLKGPVRFLHHAKIVPSPIRNTVYKTIAKNRYKWFGKKAQCMLPSPDIKARFL